METSDTVYAKEQLISFFQGFSNVANTLQRRLMKSLVISLISAIWLNYNFLSGVEPSIWLSVPFTILISIPSLVLIKLVMIYRGIGKLPKKISESGDSLLAVFNKVKHFDVIKSAGKAKEGFSFKTLRNYKGILTTIWQMKSEAGDLGGIVGEAIFIVSPLSWALTVVGLVGTGVLAIAAVIVVAVALF